MKAKQMPRDCPFDMHIAKANNWPDSTVRTGVTLIVATATSLIVAYTAIWLAIWFFG